MIVVTGNGDLPLATQRRVERRASLLIDRPSPSLDRIYQLGLWLAIFFAIFLRLPPNEFLRIPPDLSPVSIQLALLFLLLTRLRIRHPIAEHLRQRGLHGRASGGGPRRPDGVPLARPEGRKRAGVAAQAGRAVQVGE